MDSYTVQAWVREDWSAVAAGEGNMLLSFPQSEKMACREFF